MFFYTHQIPTYSFSSHIGSPRARRPRLIQSHGLTTSIKLGEIETLLVSPELFCLERNTLNSPKMCKTRAHQVGRTVILFVILGLAHFLICDGVLNSLKSSELGGMLGRVCVKSGGNCIGLVEEDVEMDSESNRRVLMMQRKRYVSYDTLRKDLVPCERPGASYYNCRSGGVANPYTRGCEVIAGCARNIRYIKT